MSNTNERFENVKPVTVFNSGTDAENTLSGDKGTNLKEAQAHEPSVRRRSDAGESSVSPSQFYRIVQSGDEQPDDTLWEMIEKGTHHRMGVISYLRPVPTPAGLDEIVEKAQDEIDSRIREWENPAIDLSGVIRRACLNYAQKCCNDLGNTDHQALAKIAEQQKEIESLRRQLDTSNARRETLHGRIQDQRRQITKLERGNVNLVEQVRQLEAEDVRTKTNNQDLRRQLDEANGRAKTASIAGEGLQRRLQQAESDKERLDWLEENFSFDPKVFRNPVSKQSGVGWPTFREAIDEARKK